MLQNTVNRIALGTMQFGSKYGMANKKGKVSKKEAFAILDYARNFGIDTIDTAVGYGESEKIIGEFMKAQKANFKIVSKFSLEDNDIHRTNETIYASLSRLKKERIYGYLLHRFRDFVKNPRIWDILEDLKEKQIIEKIGFSIYTTDELKIIREKGINYDILELPYSVFDRRFEEYFKSLKKRNVEIHARSIFLQGLAFMKPNDLPSNLFGATGNLERLRKISSDYDIPLNAICLDFVILNRLVNKAIIGIDSLEQLKRNLSSVNFIDKVREVYDKTEKVSINDEDIVLPYKWVTK